MRRAIKGSKCLNCEKPLHGENFCPQCGQLNDSRKEGLIDYIKGSVAYILGADSRLVRTLPILFFRPGLLAIQYAEGKRNRFVPPLRLFIWLLIMIIFYQKFIVSNNYSRHSSSFGNKLIVNSDSIAQDSTDGAFVLGLSESSSDELFNHALNNPDMDEIEALKLYGQEVTLMNRMGYRFVQKLGSLNQRTFLSAFLDKLLMAMLIFTPVFAAWLKLLYIRRKSIYYLDHVVFILYTQSFLLVLFLLGSIAESIWNLELIQWLLMIYLLYLWIAFSTFYQQGVFKRFVKFIFAGWGFITLGSIIILLNSFLAIMLD